jgi:hypothetical protein
MGNFPGKRMLVEIVTRKTEIFDFSTDLQGINRESWKMEQVIRLKRKLFHFLFSFDSSSLHSLADHALNLSN